MSSEITLEKVDIVRERTGASYTEAKEALVACDGNVVDAIIYIEKINKEKADATPSSMDEFKQWLKSVLEKGNVTRIRIKKDEKVLIDMPVNAGVAITVIVGIISAELLTLGVIAGAVVGVATNITIEIVKKDGDVEVINKAIKNTVDDVKDKFTNFASDIKEKSKFGRRNVHDTNDESNVYKYTVKFDDLDNDNDKDSDKNNNE